MSRYAIPNLQPYFDIMDTALLLVGSCFLYSSCTNSLHMDIQIILLFGMSYNHIGHIGNFLLFHGLFFIFMNFFVPLKDCKILDYLGSGLLYFHLWG